MPIGRAVVAVAATAADPSRPPVRSSSHHAMLSVTHPRRRQYTRSGAGRLYRVRLEEEQILVELTAQAGGQAGERRGQDGGCSSRTWWIIPRHPSDGFQRVVKRVECRAQRCPAPPVPGTLAGRAWRTPAVGFRSCRSVPLGGAGRGRPAPSSAGASARRPSPGCAAGIVGRFGRELVAPAPPAASGAVARSGSTRATTPGARPGAPAPAPSPTSACSGYPTHPCGTGRGSSPMVLVCAPLGPASARGGPGHPTASSTSLPRRGARGSARSWPNVGRRTALPVPVSRHPDVRSVAGHLMPRADRHGAGRRGPGWPRRRPRGAVPAQAASPAPARAGRALGVADPR